ncbi:MAG: hypothetical protein ACK5LS_08505 [Propioniciclava sp.]
MTEAVTRRELWLRRILGFAWVASVGITVVAIGFLLVPTTDQVHPVPTTIVGDALIVGVPDGAEVAREDGEKFVFATAGEPTGECTFLNEDAYRVHPYEAGSLFADGPSEQFEEAGITYTILGWTRALTGGDGVTCPGVSASDLMIATDGRNSTQVLAVLVPPLAGLIIVATLLATIFRRPLAHFLDRYVFP